MKSLNKYIIGILLFILILGAVSTAIHFTNKTVGYENVLKININLILICLLITLGLIIRFVKWHFFLRLSDVRLKIRKSFGIFFSSLFVNLFFPFLIGEVLTKNFFLRRENYTNTGRNILIIVFERLLDVLAIIMIGIFFLAFTSDGIKNITTKELLFIGVGVGVILFTTLLFAIKIKPSLKLFISFVLGLIGWSVIYLIYFTFPASVANAVSFPDFSYVFSNYLIFYPTTPMGIFISGNYLYLTFEKIITDPAILLQTVINIRIASIAPALIIGGISTYNLLRRKHVDEFHFDEISDEYSDMIPSHIRERLIERKCLMMKDELQLRMNGASKYTGLDLGGGKGWYTSRMRELTGNNVVLVEYSFNQARDAKKRDGSINAVVADITRLPFKPDVIDYGFSINVFHHLEDSEAQRKAFLSFSKSLKKDKPFFLHEINVHNPLFKIYMNYFFPLVKTIDEGIERWIDPSKNKFGDFVSDKITYFTFLPEFTGKFILKLFLPIERRLEKSKFNKYSAHYFRVFENRKDNN